MIKKFYFYKIASSLFYRMNVKMNEKVFQNRLKYVFKYKKNSRKLVVVFSGFPGMDKAKYNYMRTLKHAQCSQLFILDDFGFENKGSYYLAENGDYYIRKMVINLIKTIKAKYDISEMITAGSSKGGACAIYFGLKLGAEAIIAGAPQYYLADYLKNGHEEILKGIIGGYESQISYLNSLLEETIQDYQGHKPTIYLHYSKEEHTYVEHVQYLLNELKENKFTVIEDIGEYSEHSNVSFYFPKFLKESIDKELRK